MRKGVCLKTIYLKKNIVFYDKYILSCLIYYIHDLRVVMFCYVLIYLDRLLYQFLCADVRRKMFEAAIILKKK